MPHTADDLSARSATPSLRQVRRAAASRRSSCTPIDGPFAVDGIAVTPVPILHGQRPILGFRLGGFAYLTDCSAIPDPSWPLLDGLDVLVLDALRHRPHPTHFTVQEALAAIERIGPGRALPDAHLPRPAARRHESRAARRRRARLRWPGDSKWWSRAPDMIPRLWR